MSSIVMVTIDPPDSFALTWGDQDSQALQVELASIDIILVGDSCGMVELGMKTGHLVAMEEMLHHCKAVSKGASMPLLVGDMPFGSYKVNENEALRNAYR